MNLFSALLGGIFLGGYYAILACGLSFMFGVMRVINLAHGALAILAGYLFCSLAESMGVPPYLALFLVVPVMAAVGLFLQWAILERASRSGELIPILATFGLSIVLENALFQHYGADTRSLAPYVGSLSYDSIAMAPGLFVGVLPLVTFASAIVLLGGLQLFLTYTRMGRSIRATAWDPDTAQLVGINSKAVNAFAAAIAMATVALGGLFLGMRSAFDPYAGSMQLIFAFEAAVIGGTGSLWGTLAGGVILGVAQTLGARIHPQGFMLAGHAVFLLVLIGRIYLAGPLLSRK